MYVIHVFKRCWELTFTVCSVEQCFFMYAYLSPNSGLPAAMLAARFAVALQHNPILARLGWGSFKTWPNCEIPGRCQKLGTW